MKVRLIEDSEFQRIANGRALIRAGYDVVYAARKARQVGGLTNPCKPQPIAQDSPNASDEVAPGQRGSLRRTQQKRQALT
jgi:hypothetical protein